MALYHFLIIYNVRDEKLVSMEEFGTDSHRATAAYTQAEREYRARADHGDFEIVLVGADSVDTLQVTHSRYFGTEELVPFGE